jgi:uncharacterized protein YuzE
MKQRYLQVTFRKGKPFAAYLYLPRPTGARAARTIDAGSGVRIDFDDRGAAIGVEITAPSAISVARLNAILAQNGIAELDATEFAPLAA